MSHNKYLFIVILVMVFSGCSTRKNTWLSRGYQNLTARYNLLFNGLQSFDEGRTKMRKSMTDDFTVTIPLFAFSTGSGASVASSQMQRAISKGNKLIKDHSITVKPKRKPKRGDDTYEEFYNQREFNRWVDDAWMLIGKGHVYQRDWPEAIYAFEMVLREFPSHPSRFEALLWMARAYVEAGQLENAQLALNRYESEGDAPSRFYGDFMASYARFWLAGDNYEKALPYITAAAENASDRWEHVRFTFVLGQVCERLGLDQRAEEAFNKVVRLNPDYEMSFYARVKVALLKGYPDNSLLARERLNKYLHQSKNREYRDQLYFAMADTWFWEKDTLQALTNLKLAAGYSSGNQILKGKIYLKMADVYLDTREYIAAHAYYDSSLVMLNPEDIRLAEVKMLSKKLAPLSAQLQVVEHEDSLQRIAALPQDQRAVFLENLLAMYQQEEESGSFSSAADDAFFFRNLSSGVSQTTDDQGNWYFYNQNMVSLGKMEFEKRWGRRPLADDWRRLDKKAQSAEPDNQGLSMGPTDPFSPQGGPGAAPTAETGQGKSPGALPDMNSLLEGLPLTPEKMEASHQRLEEAIYGAGMIFYEQLDRYSESREMLTKLLLEYPETEHRKQALMTLFLACQQMGNGACMAQRKQEYLSEFPDTPFGEYLRDPDFLEKQKALEEEMNQNYREAYHSYKVGAWSHAIAQTREVMESRFEPLKPKASLLMAMAYGRKGEAKLFEAGLSEVVANYQGSPEASLAGEWLSMLNEGRRPVKLESGYAQEAAKDAGVEEAATSGTLAEQKGFMMEPDSVHYLLIAVNNDANINQLIFNVADYNFEHFLIGDYQLKTDRLADGKRMLKVGPFPNKNIGMDYYFSVRDNTAIFKGTRAGGTTLLLISANNLKPLLLSSDILGYQGFFLEQYLTGSEVSAVVISEREVPAEEVMVEEVTVEEAVAYSMGGGPMLGMVVIPSNSGNKKRAMQFLPNYVRNIISVSVSVSEEQLDDGTDVLLVDGFPGLTEFEKLKEALAKNPYWNGQLAGADWQVCPVSGESLKQIREQGSVKDYLKFVENELGN